MLSGKDAEASKLKVEGDLVTSFFDQVDQLDDHTLFQFIEDMKRDKDLIMQTLFGSANEMIVFFSYLLLMLKRLQPISNSFTNTMQMTKELAGQINDELGTHSPPHVTQSALHQFQRDFNKFFMRHLLRNYCSIIRESPAKRQYMCELIYAHCAHDLQMRIKVVKSLKQHIQNEEVVYACHASLISCEENFNE